MHNKTHHVQIIVQVLCPQRRTVTDRLNALASRRRAGFSERTEGASQRSSSMNCQPLNVSATVQKDRRIEAKRRIFNWRIAADHVRRPPGANQLKNHPNTVTRISSRKPLIHARSERNPLYFPFLILCLNSRATLHCCCLEWTAVSFFRSSSSSFSNFFFGKKFSSHKISGEFTDFINDI